MDNNTVLAAVISAAVASIGVTLSKDNKVSEFRQQWIDALRQDCAEYIALLSRAYDVTHLPPKAPRIEEKDNAQLTERLNIAMYRILLRLDIKDGKKRGKADKHRQLQNALVDGQTVAMSSEATHDSVSEAMNEIHEKATAVLDAAWEAVKDGEPRYRKVLFVAYAALAACCLLLLLQVGWNWRHRNDEAATTVRLAQPVSVEIRSPREFYPAATSQPQSTSGRVQFPQNTVAPAEQRHP